MAFFELAGKPAKVHDSQWVAFQEFVARAGDDALLEYIKSFDWNVEAPPSSQMPVEIKAELLRYGRAAWKQASEGLYERLFLVVIKRLAERGLKVLTVEELDAVRSRPGIEPADEQLLGVVRILISSVDERIRNLEEITIRNQEYLKRMEADLGLLARPSEFQAAVEYAVQNVPLDIPPSVDRPAKRSATVSRFVKILEERAWCALNGEVGSGKTQLVILILKVLNRPAFWIGLRNLDVWQSCLRLDAALAAASRASPKREFRKWYSEVCGALGEGAVVVLDDLPRRITSDDLDSRLLLLSESCSRNGCTLISTSNEELPPTVRERAGQNLVTAKIPLFNEEEVKELFLAYGAPPKLLNAKFVSFLWSLARGHPMLLTGIARYLLSTDWRINDSQLQGLFKGDYAEDLRTHTRKLLTTTVDDPKSRELLYRLNLAGFSFEAEHVRLVGEVKPRIDRPMEKLAQAQGLWIQRDSGSRYVVSPLLSNLGASDLSFATQRKVHEVLGLNIMSKGTLGPFDVLSAFNHFASAHQYERAATVLILALSYFTGLGKPVADDWLVTSIWAEEPLPKGIRLGARLYLRSLQVIARRQLGKDIRYPLGDFDSLLALATEEDAFGIVGGCIGLAIHLAHEEPVRANRYLLEGIKSLPAFVFPDASRPEIPNRARPERLLFITGLAIRSEEDLRDWISTVEELDDQTFGNLFCSELGEDASVALCDHLWLQEDKKSPGSQNWDAISGQLAMLDDFAGRHNLQLWRVSSVRTQIIVLSEYRKNLPECN